MGEIKKTKCQQKILSIAYTEGGTPIIWCDLTINMLLGREQKYEEEKRSSESVSEYGTVSEPDWG